MKNHLSSNVDQLTEMHDKSGSQLPFDDSLDSSWGMSDRKDVFFTKKIIQNLTGVKSGDLSKVIEDMERENGYEYLRLTNQWLQLTRSEAVDLIRKFNIYPMEELRKKHGAYDVPVICINSGKGGVAKTTTAISLATQSALDIVRSKRVLLIDGDPQGSIRHFMLQNDLVLKSHNCVGSVFKKFSHLTRDERLSESVQKTLRDLLMKDVVFESSVENLWFTPALMSDSGMLITISEILGKKGNAIDDAITLYNDLIVTPLKNDFDIMYIDTSPTCDPITYSIYYASNYLIIPTTGRTQDYKAYREYLTLVQLILKNCMPSDFKGFYGIHTLVTKHLKSNDVVQRNASSILSSSSTFSVFIEESKAYESASREQLPIQLYDSGSKSYRDAIASLSLLHGLVMKMIEPNLFPEM